MQGGSGISVDGLLESGRRALGAGEFEDALQCAQRVLRDALDPRAVVLVARVEAARGDLDAGLVALRRALVLSPDDVGLRLELCRWLAASGRFGAADAELRRLVQSQPDAAEGWAALAHRLAERTDARGALRASTRALRLSPRHDTAWRVAANACQSLGRYRQEERLLRERVARVPACAAARVRLAAALREGNTRARESAALLREARALAPGDPEVEHEHGLQLLARGSVEAGLHALRCASRRGHAGAQYALAQRLLGSKRRTDVLRGIALLRRVGGRPAAPGNTRALVRHALFELTQHRLAGRPGRWRALHAHLAARGVVAAQLQLARSQTGTAGNAVKAAGWYALAAAEGDAEARCELACCYDAGVGVPRDPGRARSLFESAAREGHAYAQYSLGVLLDADDAGPREPAKALRWVRRAVRSGFPGAEFYLALLYETGEGVQRDEVAARRWYGRAARQGHPAAQYHLGLMTLMGRGGPRDDAGGACWLEAAAGCDLEEAQHDLALLFRFGTGVPPDPRRSYWWFSRAAHHGHAPSQVCLGTLLLQGDGVRASQEQGAGWLLRAAESGDAIGQRRIARCYASGTGVPRDMALAFRWALSACEQGDPEAHRLRHALEPLLTTRDRWEVRRLYAEACRATRD